MKTSIRTVSLWLCMVMAAVSLTACGDRGESGSSADAVSGGVTETTAASEEATETGESETGQTTGTAGDPGSAPDASGDPGKSTTRTTTTGRSGQTTAAPAKNKPAKDLKGRVIGLRIAENYFPNHSTDSKLNERITKRLEQLEKDFHCEVKLLKDKADYASCMAAGTYYADIAGGAAYLLKDWIRSGWVKSFNELGLDTNQAKFIASYKKAMKYDNKDYALNFTSWYNQIPAYDNMLLYNKTAFERLKLSDPQKLAEQKKWTWDAFRSISKKFAAQGKGYYGSTGHSPHQQAIWSTGSREIVWDTAAKKWVFGYKNNSKIFDALNWSMELWHYDKTYLPLQEDWTYNSYQVFNKGKSAFIIGEMNWMYYGFYNDMEDDYALIPFPTQDGSVYAAGRLSVNVDNFFIPATVKDPKDVALFFDAWSEPLPGTDNNTWESYMLENVWRGNENSMKWYKQMLLNAESDKWIDVGHSRITTVINALDEVVAKRTMTGAEAVEAITAPMDAYIDEYINSDPKLNLTH